MQNFSNRQEDDNIFKRAADVFYGEARKKEKEEKDLRNSLLYELRGKLTPAQEMYADTKKLQEIKEKEGLNMQNSSNSSPAEFKKYNNYQNSKNSSSISDEPESDIVTGKNFTYNTRGDFDNTEFSPEAYKRVEEFIKKYENYSETAYRPTTTDKLTIGFGHTRNVKEGDRITKEEAERLFKEDFKRNTATLKNIRIPLKDNEKVALGSLLFNAGPGALDKERELTKKLNKGDKKGALEEFNWVIQNGEVLKGLVNRRNAEKEIFKEGWSE